MSYVVIPIDLFDPIAGTLTPKEIIVPKGSKVHRCFEKVKQESGDAGKAARICQSATGQSLATGRKPKGKAKGK